MDCGTGIDANMFLTPRKYDNNARRFAIKMGEASTEQRITGTTVLAAGYHNLAATLS